MTHPAAVSSAGTGQADQRRARLEALFAAHGAAVFAFARRRAAREDADEVVSETFLVAWRRLDDLPEEPLPWLIGVARRCLANQSRGEARRGALRMRLAAQAAPTAVESPATDVSARVRASLDRLSPAERDAITLLAWDGLTPEEIAGVLGCSRAAVYLRLHRARRRLTHDLNPLLTSGDDDD